MALLSGSNHSLSRYDRDLIKPNLSSYSAESDCSQASSMAIATTMSMSGPKKSLRAVILMLVCGIVMFSVMKELKYTGTFLAVEYGDAAASAILQEAQRQTRIKFFKNTNEMVNHTVKLDLNTVKLVKDTLHHLLEQVEEEIGAQSKISVGLLKDSLFKVMEHIEIEATGSASSHETVGVISSTASIVSDASLQRSEERLVALGGVHPTKQNLPESDVSIASAKSNHLVKAIPPPPPSLRSSDPSESVHRVENSVAASGIRPDGLKIALYMTTHVSDEHLEYINKCWPAAMKKLDIMQNVDLIVYTSSQKHDIVFNSMGFHHVTIHRYNETVDPKYAGVPAHKIPNDKNMQKQKGALKALVDPWLLNPSAPESSWKLANTSWFDDYDWVIRVNPDVLIRDDQWLLQQMRNTTTKGIFVRWDFKNNGLYLHTDFFAFRPTAINFKALFNEYLRQSRDKKFHAELHFTAGFRHILGKQPPQVAFLPGVEKWRAPGPGIGHVSGYDAPVTHVHGFVKHCPNYFGAHDEVTRYY